MAAVSYCHLLCREPVVHIRPRTLSRERDVCLPCQSFLWETPLARTRHGCSTSGSVTAVVGVFVVRFLADKDAPTAAYDSLSNIVSKESALASQRILYNVG